MLYCTKLHKHCNQACISYFDAIGIHVYNKKCEYYDKDNCLHHLQNIDDEIFHIVQELNQKGYMTTFSCSGHFAEQIVPSLGSMYISLHLSQIKELSPKDRPLLSNELIWEGSSIRGNNDFPINESRWKKDIQYRINIQRRCIDALYKYAEQLPERNTNEQEIKTVSDTRGSW